MPVSRRYTPEHGPGESCVYGYDFSFIVPRGVGLLSGVLKIFTNTADPQPSTDLGVGPVQVEGRTVYATVGGGAEGTDYQLRWSVTDTDGNVWPRTALVLCAQTS